MSDNANSPAPASDDIGSIDAIVAALYDAVSYPPGEAPDWDRLRSLFHPAGRLVPPRTEDAPAPPVLDLESFIARSMGYIRETGLDERGFHERELSRRTERFGQVAHVFSSYESRHRADDAEPIGRGVNSIQLVRAGDRWWVTAVAWDVERPDRPLPDIQA